MTQLIRASLLHDAMPKEANLAHAGLWLTRGLAEFSETDADAKTQHIDKLCQQKPSEIYKLAWRRWLMVIGNSGRFCCLHAKLAQRLLIGQSNASALETGICVSHSYGMPMIPGSTAKGCAQAYAKKVGIPPEYRAVLFGEDEESAENTNRIPGAACLIWHDAWWNPDCGKSPFVREIVTTHHMKYYAGEATEATDFDSPIPNAQIATQGSFCFAIEGPYAWTAMGIELLKKALAETGIGAKRAAGYGVMKGDENAEQMHRNQLEDIEKTKKRKVMNAAQREIEQFREECAQRIGGKKNGYGGEDYRRAKALAEKARSDESWSAADKQSAAEVIEFWLPKLLEKTDAKEVRKRLKLAELKTIPT
jgi:CRISPR-associated protein Cmr6